MTLARITNYVDGNVLTGAQLNNEFDNILNNGPSLVDAAIPGVSIVQGLQGSMSTAGIGSFQANGYQLKSTSTITTLTATSSYSINTQTVGPIANGRDQAAVFASTDVHFYAITTGGTSTNARGICSSTPPPTGPTLPAGYSAWAYLASAKYSTGSSAMTNAWFQTGSRIYARAPVVISPTISTTSEAILLINAIIPSLATKTAIRESISLQATGPNASIIGTFWVGAESSPPAGSYMTRYAFEGAASTDSTEPELDMTVHADLPILTSTPELYGVLEVITGTSGTAIASVLSYTVPNGDVG